MIEQLLVICPTQLICLHGIAARISAWESEKKGPTSNVSVAAVPYVGNIKLLLLTYLAFMKCLVFLTVCFIWGTASRTGESAKPKSITSLLIIL